MSLVIVITTVNDKNAAETIARKAVESRLAACVQIVGPITSVYRWQGNVESESEFRCEMKTLADRVSRLEELICSLHPYDVPEILTVPVTYASADYEQWAREQVE